MKIPNTQHVLIASYSFCQWRRYFHPWAMGMAKHRTPDTGQMRVISHIYSPPGRGGHPMSCKATQGLHSETEWTSRSWDVGFVVSRGWSGPLAPWEGVIDLVKYFLRLAGNWNPLVRDKQVLYLALWIRRVIRLGDLIHDSRVRRGI